MATKEKIVGYSFTGAAVGSDDLLVKGAAIVQVGGSGWTGSVRVLRSFAGGSTFVPCKGLDGNDIALTAAGVLCIDEPDEDGGLYKAEATSMSGTCPVTIKDAGERRV